MDHPPLQAERLTDGQYKLMFLEGLGTFLATSGLELAVILDPSLRAISGLSDDANPFQHMGNVWPSSIAALAVPIVTAVAESRRAPGSVSTTRRVVAAAALGLAVGGALNACTDTKWGNDHIGKYGIGTFYDWSYPDSSDLAWGTASTALISGGLAASRARRLTKNRVAIEHAQSDAITAFRPLGHAEIAAMPVVHSAEGTEV